MSLNRLCWSLWIADIPHLELLVVGDSAKDKLVEVVPADVFHDGGVRLEVEDWLLVKLVLVRRAYVPHANSAVIRAREKQSFFHGVPGKSVAFLRMAEQSQVRLHLVVEWRFWVFEVVKQINFSVNIFGCDYFLILRHVSGFVYFASMVYLNINRNSCLFCVGN